MLFSCNYTSFCVIIVKRGDFSSMYFENKSENIFLSLNNKTYNFPAHFHSYIEFAFCLSGKQKIRVGENIYTLKKGDAVAIFPYAVHEYIEHIPRDKNTRMVALICDTGLLSQNLPDIITKMPENPFIPANMLSETTAFAIEKITISKNKTEMLGWTYIILSDILNVINFTDTGISSELPSKIIAYIDAHFKEDLSINSIAKTFGYHPSYIAHLFCDRLKIPFKTYLGMVRSEYAVKQIRSTQKSLTEIAFESGYNSLNTFCRNFKKHFSETPTEYRKKYN